MARFAARRGAARWRIDRRPAVRGVVAAFTRGALAGAGLGVAVQLAAPGSMSGVVAELAGRPGVVVTGLAGGGAAVVTGAAWRRIRRLRRPARPGPAEAAARLAAAGRWDHGPGLPPGDGVDRFLRMRPDEFERALAGLCARDGCTDVTVVGGAGDLGADVTATTPLGTRLIIQAKRYAAGCPVRGPELQRFGGTCYAVHGADVAAVVTTSRFTRQAELYARQLGIRIFDGSALVAWAGRVGPPPWQCSAAPGHGRAGAGAERWPWPGR